MPAASSISVTLGDDFLKKKSDDNQATSRKSVDILESSPPWKVGSVCATANTHFLALPLPSKMLSKKRNRVQKEATIFIQS